MIKKCKILKDCFCEFYLHNKKRYPNLIERKLHKNDIVTFRREIIEVYGTFILVNDINNNSYLIDQKNIKFLK